MERSLSPDLSEHVFVLGTSELTPIVVDELELQVPFLVVTDDEVPKDGFELGESSLVLEGDPGSRENLGRARIHDAVAVIAAAETDAEDTMPILTVKKTNPSITVVAAASNNQTVAKLKRAGADIVISPHTIGGHLLVKSALSEPDPADVADTCLDSSYRVIGRTRDGTGYVSSVR